MNMKMNVNNRIYIGAENLTAEKYESLIHIMANSGINNFSIINMVHGCWQGTSEKSIIIDIVSEKSIRSEIYHAVKAIKILLQEDFILVTEQAINACLI